MGSIPDDAPRPRLCHMRKLADFTGYGFNLHADKGTTGQYIGKVEAGSPAAIAGIHEGDRVVEVNGTNIGNENHHQVVQRIKSVPDEAKLLVVDAKADNYYRERKIVISGYMENIETLPAASPQVIAMKQDVQQLRESDVRSSSHNQQELSPPHPPRLCHMKIWPDYPGYGFNLHAEKSKPAQFIGKIDAGSPAEAAGLQESDTIVEVNGGCILAEGHLEVVRRIKSDPKQVTMLLVDPETEEYYRERGVTVSSQLPNILRIVCPDLNPNKDDATSPKISSHIAPSPLKADTKHIARLCHIRATPEEGGFGFNMQAEKDRPGQYVGCVDAGSPAEKAGLKTGDRIVEVNGVNIEKNTHREVVEKIKAVPNDVRLLTVDAEADQYFRERGMVISGKHGFINGSGNKSDKGEINAAYCNDENIKDVHQMIADETDAMTLQDQKEEVARKAVEERRKQAEITNSSLILKVEMPRADEFSLPRKTSSDQPSRIIETPKSPTVISGIEFAVSAEEARRKMCKKRNNVDATGMSMKDKYALFQKL